MADKKKMSVAEILAAARGEGKAAGKEAAMPADQPAAAQAETPQSSADSPAATPAAPKPGSAGRPSVKDILAMARSKGAAASPVDAAPAKPKPAPKTAAGKPAPAKKPNAPVAGPKKMFSGTRRASWPLPGAARSRGPSGRPKLPSLPNRRLGLQPNLHRVRFHRGPPGLRRRSLPKTLPLMSVEAFWATPLDLLWQSVSLLSR